MGASEEKVETEENEKEESWIRGDATGKTAIRGEWDISSFTRSHRSSLCYIPLDNEHS